MKKKKKVVDNISKYVYDDDYAGGAEPCSARRRVPSA